LIASSQADEVAPAKPVAVDQSAAEKKLEGLSRLKDDLGIWLNLDSLERGGVAWSRFPVTVSVTKEAEVLEKDGRKYMDFRLPGAVLTFEPAFKLGERYTLGTWMLFPAPKAHALVWQGDGQAPRRYGVISEGLRGWHHLAVTADGKETHAFLDGEAVGSIEEIVATDLRSIGNHWDKTHQNWMMCAGLDDQFIFRRDLTVEEIRKVMQFGKPAAAK